MNIRTLYEKLSTLDTAQAETAAELQSIRDEIASDIRGLQSTLGGVIASNLPSLVSGHLGELDGAFLHSGRSFSPKEFAQESASNRLASAASEERLLAEYEAESVSALESRARKEDRSLQGLAEHILDVNLRIVQSQHLLEPVSRFNQDSRNVDENGDRFKMTPASTGHFEGSLNRWKWVFDGTYRRGREALAEVKERGAVSYQEESAALNVLQVQLAQLKEDQAVRDSGFQALQTALAAHQRLAKKVITPEEEAAQLKDKTLDALYSQDFVDQFVPLLPKKQQDDFMNASVKLHGLLQARDFLDGKLGEIDQGRKKMSPTLSKLRRAKSSSGSSTAKTKTKEADLDKAIAGTRLQGAYMARNAVAARQSAMRFDTQSSSSTAASNTLHDSNSFLMWWLIFNTAMLNDNSIDRAYAQDLVGVTERNADQFGLTGQDISVQPNYTPELIGMAQQPDQVAMLEHLGVNADSIATLSQIDLGTPTQGLDVSQSFGDAVSGVDVGNLQVEVPQVQIEIPQIQIDVPTVDLSSSSFTVDTSSISTSVDTSSFNP